LLLWESYWLNESSWWLVEYWWWYLFIILRFFSGTSNAVIKIKFIIFITFRACPIWSF
jgi:hypothetical protein